MLQMLKDKLSKISMMQMMNVILIVMRTHRALILQVLKITRMKLHKQSLCRLKQSLIWLKQPLLRQKGSFPGLRQLKRGLILRIARNRNEARYKVKYWLKLKPKTRPMSRNKPEIFLLNSNQRSEVASRWPQKEPASVATLGLFK